MDTEMSDMLDDDSSNQKVPVETQGIEVESEPKDHVPPEEPSQPVGQSVTAGWLESLGCRRRATRDVVIHPSKSSDSGPTGYRELVKRGREISDQAKYARMAWWSEARYKRGEAHYKVAESANTDTCNSQVFVLAPRGKGAMIDMAKVDMWKLLGYAMSQMHDHVVRQNKRYTLLWMCFGDHRLWPWQVLNVYRNIHERYVTNLDAIHIVHPSWTVRSLRLIMWPLERFLPEDIWERFHAHERIEFLDSEGLNTKRLDLPDDIIKYDKSLDEHAEESMRMASDMLGGSGSMGMGSPFPSRHRYQNMAEESDGPRQRRP